MNSGVEAASWDAFIDGNSFIGVYKPRELTYGCFDLAIVTAKELAGQNIGYNVAYQINYGSSRYGKTVYPGDITSIRCDGVVEYSYEFNGTRIYGNDSYWNISAGSFASKDLHSGTAITPVYQSKCMYAVLLHPLEYYK